MDVNRYFRFLVDVYRYSKSLIDVVRYFRFLTDASGYLILVEFSRILRLVESGGFLRYKVDISGNLSGLPRFRFRVKVVYYKAFLLIIKGSK